MFPSSHLPLTHGRLSLSFMFTYLRLTPLLLRKEGLHCVSRIISCIPCIYTFVQPVALAFAYNIRRTNVCDVSFRGAAWEQRGSLSHGSALPFPSAFGDRTGASPQRGSERTLSLGLLGAGPLMPFEDQMRIRSCDPPASACGVRDAGRLTYVTRMSFRPQPPSLWPHHQSNK